MVSDTLHELAVEAFAYGYPLVEQVAPMQRAARGLEPIAVPGRASGIPLERLTKRWHTP